MADVGTRLPGSGAQAEPAAHGVKLSRGPAPRVRRIAFWPDRCSAAARRLCAELRAPLPAPGRWTRADAGGRLARMSPTVFWRLEAPEDEVADPPPEDGAATEIGDGLASLQVRGPDDAALLARALPLDLRPSAFPRDAIAQTSWRHAQATVLRNETGFELWLPLSFFEDAQAVLSRHAVQFG